MKAEPIDPTLAAMSKTITQKYKGLNWVQRGLTPEAYPSIKNEDGSVSTHLMMYRPNDDGSAFVFPSIVQKDNGELHKFDNEDDAFDYASKTNTLMKVPSVKLAEFYSKNGLINHKFQYGGEPKTIPFTEALKHALLMEPTGNYMYDHTIQPSNELGVMSELSTAAKSVSSIVKSLFGKKGEDVSEAVKKARKFFGDKFQPEFVKVEGPHPFSISKHGLTMEGRDALLVKNENTGEVQPFYKRTGSGNRNTDGVENLNTTGQWVPYYGHGSLPNYGTKPIDAWFIKPVNGRTGDSQMQAEAGRMLNTMLGTGEQGAARFRNRFSGGDLGSMLPSQRLNADGGEAVNALYRAYGFDPAPYASYYGIKAHQYGGAIKATKMKIPKIQLGGNILPTPNGSPTLPVNKKPRYLYQRPGAVNASKPTSLIIGNQQFDKLSDGRWASIDIASQARSVIEDPIQIATLNKAYKQRAIPQPEMGTGAGLKNAVEHDDPQVYPDGGSVDPFGPGSIFGMLGGDFASKAKSFADMFSGSVTPSLNQSILGSAPDPAMSKSDFAKSEGLNPRDPFSFLHKKSWTLGKDYKNYKNDYQTNTVDAYNNKSNNFNAKVPELLGALSMLFQGMNSQNKDMRTPLDLTPESEVRGYKFGGSALSSFKGDSMDHDDSNLNDSDDPKPKAKATYGPLKRKGKTTHTNLEGLLKSISFDELSQLPDLGEINGVRKSNNEYIVDYQTIPHESVVFQRGGQGLEPIAYQSKSGVRRPYVPKEGIQSEQFGGIPVNATGYTNGSDTAKNPMNLIPSGHITMEDTLFPLLATPLYEDRIGQTVKMSPGSKHFFKGAVGVLETPAMQYGGDAPISIPLIPLQAEKGEMLSHLDLDITKVLAKKLHKFMKKDLVTDIVPAGSFVASNDPKMIITQKEGDLISLGYEPVHYKEGEMSTSEPKEIKFSDIMDKEEMTPADIFRKLQKRYKLTDRKNDKFAQLSNEENKMSRKPYIDIVKILTELKRPRNAKIQNSDGDSDGDGYNDTDADGFKYGGVTVPKLQLGDILGSVINLGTNIWNKADQAKNYKATLGDINSYKTNAKSNLNNQLNSGIGLTMANYASQDLTPTFLDLSGPLGEIDNTYDTIGKSIDAQKANAFGMASGQTNSAFRNLSKLGSFQDAANTAAYIQGNNINATNNLNLQYSQLSNNNTVARLMQRLPLLNRLAADRQATITGTRSQRNLLNASTFSNLGKSIGGYYGDLSGIETNTLGATMGARNQNANFNTQNRQILGNSLTNGIDAYQQYLAKAAGLTTKKTTGGGIFDAGGDYIGE